LAEGFKSGPVDLRRYKEGVEAFKWLAAGARGTGSVRSDGNRVGEMAAAVAEGATAPALPPSPPQPMSALVVVHTLHPRRGFALAVEPRWRAE